MQPTISFLPHCTLCKLNFNFKPIKTALEDRFYFSVEKREPFQNCKEFLNRCSRSLQTVQMSRSCVTAQLNIK